MREVHESKSSYKYRKIINELRKGEDIAVLKADKGRGVVIMNKDKYHEKFLELLDTEQLGVKYKMLCVRLSPNFQLTSINEYIRLARRQENSMEQPKSTNSPTVMA